MKKKVLIIDDNDHLAMYLERRLAAAGHEAVVALSGLAAVKALSDYTPDFIFCDYFLPNIDGGKLCQIIRRMDHLRDAVVIVMSAAASELELHPADMGARAVIAKKSFVDTAQHMLAIIENPDDNGIPGIENVVPRQLTKELLIRNSYLQALLDSMAEGLLEIFCGRVVFANAPAASMLDKPLPQLLTAPLASLFATEANREIEAAIASGSSGPLLVTHPPAEGRRERFLSIKILPREQDDSPVILLMEDATERIQTEEALRKSQHDLEALVRERTADLERAHEQLQQAQKLEAMGTMAGGIAHDFNNILGGMIGYVELARMKAVTDKQRHYLDQALLVSNRAIDLIKQILIFSRQRKQHRKPLLVASLVKEGLRMITAVLPSTIRIEQQIGAPEAMILTDAAQMHQILMNLCNNAAHAMREKGGKLNVALRELCLSGGDPASPPDLRPGRYVDLTVQDTGHGIDPAVIDRIFDPFFTTKQPGEGTGLGLSVVYGIVQEHGGKLDIASQLGVGTTIRIILPTIEAAACEGEAESAPLPTGTERLLLVDDEAAILEAMDSQLTSLGYRVTARQSSPEALEIFRPQPEAFDLVVTDMTMPELRGDDLAREILKIRPDIPIILCSGYNEMISNKKAREIGIRQFIMKPVYMREMAQAIRTALA